MARRRTCAKVANLSLDSKQRDKQEDAHGDETVAAAGGRIISLLRSLPLVGKIQIWAGGHWLRRGLIAGAIAGIVLGTVTAWIVLARAALRSGQVPLQVALDALDKGQTEQARAMVSRMLTSGLLENKEYGGPLFVLGAIKTLDAEQATTADKRRVDFLVASRYLKEARAYGLPAGREKVGEYLFGKSLIESNQPEEGMEILDRMLEAEGDHEGPMTWAIHRLLAHTCLAMPEPELERALAHSNKALENASLPASERAEALMDRATCLARLGRFEEARQSLDEISPEIGRSVNVLLTRAQVTLGEIEAAMGKSDPQERGGALAHATPKLDEAVGWIDEAAAQAKADPLVVRRAAYLRGSAMQLKGDTAVHLREFRGLRQLYGDTPEGVAAALNEADLLRDAGDFENALIGYRRVLDWINSQATYRSLALPISGVRERLLAALSDYVKRERFEDALALLGKFTPLFSRAEELRYRGETLQLWGQRLLGQASEDPWAPSPVRTEGLRHFREAGAAYEQLAELRFATEAYVNDLWTGAEDYYLGHSFSRAILLLNKFLANAAELRNAQALLRLGQSYLALGKIPQSVAAFEECVEFHPTDSATYQARIDCAKANWYRGDLDAAEELLTENITGSELKPSSAEWKDSKFELGLLQYEKGDYERAIGSLEEAIERYKGDPQTLVARYVVGEAYLGLAEQLRDQEDQDQPAAAAGERVKNEELAAKYLETALAYFVDVRKSITVEDQNVHGDPMKSAMIRNCYMLAGAVLFELKRYNEAINAYSYVSSLYPSDPFVLETFVQISNCWRRLDQPEKARGAVQQAQTAFDRLPADADFTTTTAFSREEWRQLLADMAKW